MTARDEAVHVPFRARGWQGRILCACVREDRDAARSLAAAGPADALSTLPLSAARHRVVGLVHAALAGSLPPQAGDALEALFREELARHLIVVANVRRVGGLLESIDLPFLVVKGPALAAVAYRRPRLRFYTDLDIVVQPGRFAEALSTLEASGAAVVDPNWPYHAEHVAGEIRVSTGIDLHWHFLFFEELRRVTAIDMEEVFARRRSIDVAGLPIATTDPADTLIHICLHACLEGGDRLIWLKDIERCVANDIQGWDDVVERALRWRANAFVGAMLQRARQVVGAPVPDDVIRSLVPNALWRALLAGLDRAFPVGPPRPRETPASLIAEGMQPDARSTARFLAATAARRAYAFAHRVVGKGAAEAGAAAGPADLEARAEFLARVESHA